MRATAITIQLPRGFVLRKVVASDPRWVALKAKFRTEIGAVA